MGDAAYKKRKKNEWIAAGKCEACGHSKEDKRSRWCQRCQERSKRRVESGDYKQHEKPRTDGNYIYA